MAKVKAASKASEGAASFEVVSLDDLSPDPSNVRAHPEANRRTMGASLRQFGPARSIVLDGKGVVRAGNGTVEAAREAGVTEVLIVDPKPGQLVAVRRRDWSATEATAYSITDNRATDQSYFINDDLAAQLSALRAESFDLAAVGYSDEEASALIEGLAKAPAAPLPFTADDDDAPVDDRDEAGFGGYGDDADEEDGGQVSPPESHVRMVQLFLTVETFPEFQKIVTALANQYQTANTTDTVMENLRRAYIG
jgi:hypothetical protein